MSSIPQERPAVAATTLTTSTAAAPALAWTGLCRDDPAQRLLAVPSAAFDQQVHSAVVRRLSGGMDDLHVVLPGGPLRRLQLRAPGGQPAVVARTSPRAIGDLAGGRPAAADRPRRKLETHRQRHSDGQNPVAAAGSRGPAVFRPLDHQPVDPGLVHAQLPGPFAVPLVCPVELRLSGGAVELPVRLRAGVRSASAIVAVVGGVRGIRAALRAVRGVAMALLAARCPPRSSKAPAAIPPMQTVRRAIASASVGRGGPCGCCCPPAPR